MKVLIVRLSAIGDTIHSLPLAAALKSAMPNIKITWLVEPLSEPLVRNNPAIDDVCVFRKSGLLGAHASGGGFMTGVRDLWRLVGDLRRRRFDLAIDMQGLFKSAALTALSGAKHNLGTVDAREFSGVLLRETVDVGGYFDPDRHVVEANLKLAEHVVKKLGGGEGGHGGAMPLQTAEFPLPPPPPEAYALAGNAWKSNGCHAVVGGAQPNQVRKVVFIPGTTWKSKLWESEKWCELGKQLCAGRAKICLIGGGADEKINSMLEKNLKKSGAGIVNLTGKTTLLDLVALFKSADLVVGADCGPLHLAAATGGPAVIGILGSTPSKRNGPYGKHCRTVSLRLCCQPCNQKVCPLSTTACLRGLSVDRVMAVVTEICPVF